MLEKSLGVLRPGGQLISISGPPDPAFARDLDAGWMVRQVTRLLSYRIRRKARSRSVNYSFLFMRADGEQLLGSAPSSISGWLSVVDRVFPFEATAVALAYVEAGRAKGKVVVRMERT